MSQIEPFRPGALEMLGALRRAAFAVCTEIGAAVHALLRIPRSEQELRERVRLVVLCLYDAPTAWYIREEAVGRALDVANALGDLLVPSPALDVKKSIASV